MKKTIIANYGDPNVGKTTSINLVYHKLHQIISDANCRDLHSPEDNNGDICAILTINGVKVGISSVGDNIPEHTEWLEELKKEECDIILAACQYSEKEPSVKTIESFQPEYRILWTENARLYQYIDQYTNIAPKALSSRFNEYWATEIANLIESWCYAGNE